MLNAIRYMTRSGDGWRMLPKDFPPWQTVYRWFWRFVRLMEWRERGGPAVSVPDRRGFGSRFIQRAAGHEANGTAELDFLPEGVRCRLSFLLGDGRARHTGTLQPRSA